MVITISKFFHMPPPHLAHIQVYLILCGKTWNDILPSNSRHWKSNQKLLPIELENGNPTIYALDGGEWVHGEWTS
jgi:hypothetical protein